jgi:hypothetical protein
VWTSRTMIKGAIVKIVIAIKKCSAVRELHNTHATEKRGKDMKRDVSQASEILTPQFCPRWGGE